MIAAPDTTEPKCLSNGTIEISGAWYSGGWAEVWIAGARDRPFLVDDAGEPLYPRPEGPAKPDPFDDLRGPDGQPYPPGWATLRLPDPDPTTDAIPFRVQVDGVIYAAALRRPPARPVPAEPAAPPKRKRGRPRKVWSSDQRRMTLWAG